MRTQERRVQVSPEEEMFELTEHIMLELILEGGMFPLFSSPLSGMGMKLMAG